MEQKFTLADFKSLSRDALEIANAYADLEEQRPEYTPGEVYRVRKAYISSELEKLTQDVFPSESQPSGAHSSVKIVGACLSNTRSEYEHRAIWEQLLTDWISKGVSIEYVVINSDLDTHAQTFFQSISSTPTEDGGLFLYLLDAKQNKEAQLFVKKFEESHFVIFENPKLLWVEGSHKRNTFFASNCRFYDTQTLERFSASYQAFNSSFEKMKDLSTPIQLD